MIETKYARLAATDLHVAPTWIVVYTEDDEMRFVPMDEVIQVVLVRRAEPAPDRLVVFTRAEMLGSDS